MRVFTGSAIVLAAIAAPLAHAQPSISVGSHDLLANTANQTIEVFVTGGDAIEGLNLHVQVDDGSNTNGPVIQGVDAITGTIFDSKTLFGQDDVSPEPQLFSAIVIASDDADINANGLLATITLDTTGLFAGTYDLKLAGTRNGDTNLGLEIGGTETIEPAITNGQITVVPEPTSAPLLAAGGLVLSARRRRS